MPQAITDFKSQTQVQDINQQFKERALQNKASEMNMPYVNLLTAPINSDFASFLSQKDSERANAAIFSKTGKKIRLAVIDPENEDTKAIVDQLKVAGYQVNVSLCSEESLKVAQKIYFTEKYAKKEKADSEVIEEDLGSFLQEIENLEQLRDKIENSTFDVALNLIQVGAYKTNASDIHFQPEENDVLIRFRIDGVLKSIFKITRHAYDGIMKEIKYLSDLKMNITNIPQDGQHSFIINKRKINVRVSLMPSHYGETCVMRLLDSKKSFITIDKMGFAGEALKNILEAVHLPHGMILVTGPTGSGKTTTLYSMLQSIDTNEKKVITLEDPIEYNLEGITQSQVDPEADYHFASGLRAILRQDPDVIMVGEIRDLETAETAAQASLTGHLVLTTLHTNSAVESIARLANMGVKSFILAPAMDLIIAQRLVRTLCPHCAELKPITETEKEHIQFSLQSIAEKGLEAPELPTELKHPVGCEKCAKTGFLGQIPVTEVLRFNQELRDLILENTPMPEIYSYITKNLKMVSMHEDGILKVIQGITTLDEVYRVAS
ncbi:type II/IV secretion system protein [Candidatus Peregrinibacteria bacterium]|nr:type II/IV secretion system protein [Candidatus Peregrinibacteria bacterium]